MTCPMCHEGHTDSVAQALTDLALMSRRLVRLVSRLSPRQPAARPAPDKWSAKEIVSHLTDCEMEAQKARAGNKPKRQNRARSGIRC